MGDESLWAELGRLEDEEGFLDRAALAALTGLLANPQFLPMAWPTMGAGSIAESAWNLAEAMLVERRRRAASAASSPAPTVVPSPVTTVEMDRLDPRMAAMYERWPKKR